MDILISVVLGLCAAFAGMEAVTVGAAAQSAMHQIYAALWGVAFVCSIAGIGIIFSVRTSVSGAEKSILKKMDAIIGMQQQETPVPEEAKEQP